MSTSTIFPDLPPLTTEGTYRAVRAELLPNSGEVLTIAVCAYLDGRWTASLVPNISKLLESFGATGDVFLDVGQHIVAQVKSLGTSQEDAIANVDLRLQAISLTDPYDIKAVDHSSAMRAAIGSKSLLGAIMSFPLSLVSFEAVQSFSPQTITRPRVVKAIREFLPAGFQPFFSTLSLSTKLGTPVFSGPKTLADFGVLRSDWIVQDAGNLQGSLWRLDQHRDQPGTENTRSAVTYVVSDTASRADAVDALGALREQASRRELEVFVAPSAELIAVDLRNRENAA